jgi:transposase
MPTATTRRAWIPAAADTLYLAFDLGNRIWKLAFTSGAAQPPRIRTITARDLAQLEREIAAARARFGLAPDGAVVSCYEAGRDGFWIHRALTLLEVTNHVVDSASIEGNRRGRQAKSDRLDAGALLAKLVRFAQGERRVWSVVHVPSIDDEDRRQLHRELFTLTGARTRQINRIKGLLALHGVAPLAERGLPRTLPVVRAWTGEALPPSAAARLAREWTRLTFLRRELRTLLAERRALLRAGDEHDPVIGIVRRLLTLRGIGEVSAWLYASEFFAWRRFRNRREVGALAGLCSTMRRSGDVQREQGISKAGNHHIRALAIELAWSWLRRQPRSALTLWYRRRFANGGGRMRRIGIVALARKLLIALWRYIETGVLPEGAMVKA